MGPEELLAQIRALLDQYLALGGDTPVAAEAQMLADAIDGSMGGGPEETMEPAGPEEVPEGGPPMMGAAMPPADAGPMPDIPPGDQAGNFADASSGALDFLKKRKTKAPY